MTIRNLNSTLKTSLMNYDPFIVAHLIKFERPQKVSQFGGEVQGTALDFTYITDAQHDILFDDGSKDRSGSSLGIQNYRANKVQSLGTINENIQAKASNMSLVLDSSALGASAQSTVTFTSSEMTGDVDLAERGFQEGDKVLLVGTGSNNNKYVRINSFKNEGKTIVFTPIDTISSDSSAKVFTITLASEELLTMLSDKTASSYTNYINRQVFIYKVHINPETRAIIGEPYLHFKGITNGVAIDEKLDSSKVTWTLSSHWGDFIRVQGRMTDDATHRALQVDGSPDLNSVIKSDYATDLGFMHANTAINHLATYTDTKIEYKQVDINGGWPGGKRIREIEVEVPRQTDLQFNLQAKMLPVVYGVRKVDSFPIFVDTHKDRSSEVYKIDAICEGKIAGILDIFIEDNPTICLDLPDFDSRSPDGASFDSETVEIQCNGRADRGDTLSHYSNLGSTPLQFNWSFLANIDWEALAAANPQYDYSAVLSIDWDAAATGTTNAQTGDATGILHKGSHSITSPLQADFTFYQGLEDQQADNTLTNLASNNNFKVQNSYYDGNAPYWSPNHRLLDTAYVMGKYTIAAGETTIPSLKYIVRGRDPECYNYDGSYRHDYESGTSESHSNFALGSSITLHKTSDNTQIGSTVTIIDKWSTFDSDGNRDHRFRFSTTPNLTDGSSAITAFYMKNSSNQKWHMQTWDHTEITGTVSTALSTTSFSEATGTSSGLKLTFTGSSTVFKSVLAHPKVEIGITKSTLPTLSASTFAGFTYNSSTSVIDNFSQITTVQNLNSVQIKNAIVLASGSSTDNFYNGNKITLTDNSGSTPYIQERTIVDYDGTTKVAIVNAPWDWQYIPSSGDTYAIGSIGDRRVTLNPSMQLLDYMTSKRYGKGLDISSDIDLPAWKEAAVSCDTRSDVTIAVPTSVSIAVDEVYTYPVSGEPHFMGTVKSVDTLGGKKQVVFKDVVGKLGTKWNSWKIFGSGELYWYNGKAYAGTGAVVSSAPSSNHLVSLALKKVGGSTIGIDLSESSANGNPLVKKYSTVSQSYTASGYSLYDADDVKYWRYLGWDDSSQRNVTRHQMNQVVDTKLPLFDNINKILYQFNGMLKYTSGKYSLQVKGQKGTVDAAEQITEADIIGTIKLSDKGLKNSKNYVSTSIIDPANKFEGRSVSFFNSDYLKEDKGIQKKGQFSLPGVTNYFNARFNIKQYLDESRYGLTIQFTLAPRGLLLTAGSIIELTYDRFGYNSKEFRITNLNVKKDGTVDVVADEHNDAAYVVPESTGAGYGIVEQPQIGQSPEPLPTPAAPTSLQCSQTSQGEIVLTWTNPSTFTSATHSVEIYSSTVNNFDNTTDPVTLIGTSDTNSFHDVIGQGEGNQTRYYWIRAMVRTPKFNVSGTDFRNVPSLFEPSRPSSGTFVGVQGVGQATRAVRSIKLNPGATTTFVYENDGTGIEPGFVAFTDITTTKFNDSGTVTYQWKINGSNVTNTNSDKSTYRYNAPTNYSNMPQTVTVEMTDTLSDSTTIVVSDSVSFIGVRTVIDGYTVTPSSGTHNFAATDLGAIDDISSFSTTFTVKRGGTNLTFDNASSPAANTFKYGTFGSVTPTNSVVPQVTVSDPDIIVLHASTGNFLTGTTVTQASFVVPIIENDTNTTIANIKIVLSKSLEGVNARTVSLSAPEQAIAYNSAGASPDPSAAFNITATPFNTTGTPKYQFFKGATSVQASSTNAVYAYTAPTAYSTLPEVITVKLRENDNNAVIATDTFTIFGVKEGADGTDAQNQKTVFVFKKNDDTIGFAGSNDATNQSFASPTAGLEAGWSTTQPALSSNNDKVYMSQRLFTSDAASPQASGWSDPVIVAQKTNGAAGTDAQNQKTVFVFKKNDDTIGFTGSNNATNQSFASPTTGLEAGWSTTQPALSNNGDEVYMSQRLFTSDAASPQAASWSAPVVVARRTDGINAISAGYSNQAHAVPVSGAGAPTFTGSGGVLSVFDGTTELSLKSNTQSSTAPAEADVGTYNVNIVKSSGTTLNEPAITGAGSAGATLGNFSGSALTSVTVYSLNIYIRALDGTSHTRQIDITITPADQGATGPDGLRTVHGNLFYEKDSSGAPSAPTGTTYAFSTGKVSGTGINDSGTTNVWKNEPNTQDASSGNGFYILTYFGTESAANSSTFDIQYGSIKSHTSFTGVVTFSSGDFSQGGSTINNIDGGNVQVGSTALTETNTLNANTTSTDVGLGNVNNPGSATTPIGTGEVAANIGGVGISKIEGGNILAESTIEVGLQSGTNKAGLTGTSAAGNLTGQADTDVRIYSGAEFDNRANAPFSVTQEGEINAEFGTIGGFLIGQDAIESTTAGSRMTLGSDLASNPQNQLTLTSRTDDAFLLYAGIPVKPDGGVTQEDNPPFSIASDGNVVMRSFELRDANNTTILDSDNLLSDTLMSQIAGSLGGGTPTTSFDEGTPNNLFELQLSQAQNVQIDFEIYSGGPYITGFGGTETQALNSIMPQIAVEIEYRIKGNSTWIPLGTKTLTGVKNASLPSLSAEQYWISAESFTARSSSTLYRSQIEFGYGCVTAQGNFKGSIQKQNLAAGTYEVRINSLTTADKNITVYTRSYNPTGSQLVDYGYGFGATQSTTGATVIGAGRNFTVQNYTSGGYVDNSNWTSVITVSPKFVKDSISLSDYLPKTGGTVTGNITFDTGASIDSTTNTDLAIKRAGSTALTLRNGYVSFSEQIRPQNFNGIYYYNSTGHDMALGFSAGTGNSSLYISLPVASQTLFKFHQNGGLYNTFGRVSPDVSAPNSSTTYHWFTTSGGDDVWQVKLNNNSCLTVSEASVKTESVLEFADGTTQATAAQVAPYFYRRVSNSTNKTTAAQVWADTLVVEDHYMSRGSIEHDNAAGFNDSNSVLYTMYVANSSTSAVTKSFKILKLDDDVYIRVNNVQVASRTTTYSSQSFPVTLNISIPGKASGTTSKVSRIDIIKNDHGGGDHEFEMYCLLLDRPGANQKITFQEFNDTYTENDTTYTP
jgi:hypothetical protein